MHRGRRIRRTEQSNCARVRFPADPHAYGDGHSDGNAYGNTNGHAHEHADGNANEHTDCDDDRDTDTDAQPVADVDSYANPRANRSGKVD